MSAVRLSFLQVTNSEVISPQQRLTYNDSNVPAHTHACTETHMTQFWQTDGRTDVHMLAVSDQTYRMFTQTPTTYSIHTFIQTHTPICPHVVWQIYKHLSYLVHKVIAADMPTRTNAQIRHDEKRQDMSERPMTASLISPLLLLSLLILFFVIDLSAEIANMCMSLSAGKYFFSLDFIPIFSDFVVQGNDF